MCLPKPAQDHYDLVGFGDTSWFRLNKVLSLVTSQLCWGQVTFVFKATITTTVMVQLRWKEQQFKGILLTHSSTVTFSFWGLFHFIITSPDFLFCSHQSYTVCHLNIKKICLFLLEGLTKKQICHVHMYSYIISNFNFWVEPLWPHSSAVNW